MDGRIRTWITLGTAIVALAAAAPAAADTLTVNTTADTTAVDAAVSALDSSGLISLRSAIQRANAEGGTNTITLPAGTYTITLDPITAGTDDDSAGDYNIENGEQLTIAGAGAGSTTINANGIDRAFEVDSQSGLTLTGVTVENGLPLNPRPESATTSSCPATPPTSQADGGAILQNGDLDLENDVVTDNLSSGPGGGIANEGVGNMTIKNTTISHNLVCLNPDGDVDFGEGGGVFDEDGFATDLIDSSTITDNTTADDSGGGVADVGGGNYTITNSTISGNAANSGGGIEAQAGEGPGSLTLTGDTISGNTASENGFNAPGGGIENDGVGVSVTNTTITGNTASDGGGIASPGGMTTISFSTINGNTATGTREFAEAASFSPNARQADATVPLFGPTGNLEDTDGGSFILDDTIVAGGISPSGDPTNCGGDAFTSNGYNLFDTNDPGCSTVSTDLVNTPPMLGALANNDGPTQTEAIGLASPAFNAANPGTNVCSAATAGVDQRGVARPQGPRCDIGAFELAYGDLQVSDAASSSTIEVSSQTSFTDTVTNAGPSSVGSVTFTDPAPAGFTIDSVSSTQGSCTHTSSTVSCALGTLASGSHATITIGVTATSPGVLTLSSSVASPTADPNTANNQATATVTVTAQADLAVTKGVSPKSTTVGHNLTYTMTVTDKGPQPDTTVGLTDTLPSGLTHVSTKASQGTCSGSRTITCALGTLAADAHATVTVVVHAAKAGTFKNTAHVSGALTDPNSANNSASATATVKAPPPPPPPPPLAACTQKLKFHTRFDPQARVTTLKVFLDGRRTATKHGHNVRSIVVHKVPPKGKHTVTVWFVFASGQVVTETRMYASCRPGPARYAYPPITGPGAS